MCGEVSRIIRSVAENRTDGAGNKMGYSFSRPNNYILRCIRTYFNN